MLRHLIKNKSRRRYVVISKNLSSSSSKYSRNRRGKGGGGTEGAATGAFPRFNEMNTRQKKALLHQIFDFYSISNTTKHNGLRRSIGQHHQSSSSSKISFIESASQVKASDSPSSWPLRWCTDAIVRIIKQNTSCEHPYFATKSLMKNAKRHELIRMYRLVLWSDNNSDDEELNSVEIAKMNTTSIRRRVWLRSLRDSRHRKRQSKDIECSFRDKWKAPALNSEEQNVLDLLITIGHSLRCQQMLRTNASNSYAKLKPFGFLYDMKNEHILPRARFKGQVIVAKTTKPNEVRDALKMLQNENILGFDTETLPSSSSEQNPPSLLQISSANVCVLIQIRSTKELPLELVEFLENNDIIKTGVGVLNDAKDILRYFDNVLKVRLFFVFVSPSLSHDNKNLTRLYSLNYRLVV